VKTRIKDFKVKFYTKIQRLKGISIIKVQNANIGSIQTTIKVFKTLKKYTFKPLKLNIK